MESWTDSIALKLKYQSPAQRWQEQPQGARTPERNARPFEAFFWLFYRVSKKPASEYPFVGGFWLSGFVSVCCDHRHVRVVTSRTCVLACMLQLR